jgi:hypothetical protein
MFATTDYAWHTQMVKPLRNMGTRTKTLAYFEPGVDDTIRVLCAQRVKMAREGATVRMEQWLAAIWYVCTRRNRSGGMVDP